MAILATELFPGAAGAAWGSQWTTFGAVTQLGNGTGRVQSTTATYAITATSYLNTLSVADADVVLDVAFTTVAEQYATIGLRRNTPASVGDLSSGYYVQLFPSNGANSIGINKQVGGVETALSGDLAAGTFTAGVAKRIRFRVVGTSIKVKVWDPNGVEPTTGGPNGDGWLWSGIDSSITGPGRFAFTMSAGGTAVAQSITPRNITVSDGVATAIDPSALSGLVRWLRADDVAGADGSQVASWADRAGAAAVVQAVSGQQPVIRRGVIGGQDALRFDGTDDYLAAPVETVGPYFTFFVVHTPRAAFPGTSTSPAACDYNNTTGKRAFQLFYSSATSATLTSLGSSTVSDTVPTTYAAGATAVLTTQRSSGAAEVFFNGATNGPLATTAVPVTATAAQTTVGAGRGPGTTGAQFFNGDVAEVIAYNRPLTSVERAGVHSYLQDRYGVTVVDYVATGAPTLTATGAAAIGLALAAASAQVVLNANASMALRLTLAATATVTQPTVPDPIAALASSGLRLELSAVATVLQPAAPTVAGSGGRNPFRVTVYSKALVFQQRLGSALSYSFTPRWLLGTGEVVTRTDDPVNSLLGQAGARMLVEYRSEVLMSGMVQQRTGSVIKGGSITWDLIDDRYLLTFTRAWVRPGAALTPSSLNDLAQQVPVGTHQSGRADGGGYYAFPTVQAVYPAESAVKQVIGENLARFGPNVAQGKIVVQPDAGRGGDARGAGMLPQLRFDPLHDGLLDLLEWSDLLLKVWHDVPSGTLKLDVSQPKTWVQTIGTGSRIVTDGQYQQAMPSLTRLILGGPGEDAARLYWGANDATGLEDTYGVAVEGFSDATGATLKWPDGLEQVAQAAVYYLQRSDVASADKLALQTYLVQAGSIALRAGRPTAGLSISLSETASFHYGGADGYHVGDHITVQVEGGPSITQRITECTLKFDTEGFSVTPVVGDITADPDAAMARAVSSIAQVLGRLSTRT